jgi:hypothetical protein
MTVQLVALALLLLPAAGALACEYCVREVGFVPLHGGPYRVAIAVPASADEAERDRVLAEARAAIGPGNVVVTIGSAEEGAQFADVAERAGDHLPAAVVYAPDGRNALLARSPEGDWRGLITEVDELTRSPARDGLAAALIDGYATVLLVEGTDAGANQAALELAEATIQRINAVKAGFDRVIEVGPALRIITADTRSDERWLLWSLGITDADEPMPSVAVLYGMGRRLGDVLTGHKLTDHALFTMLSIVARDCECDLDRGWLYGTSIPLVWDDALRRRAYDALGFDPESAATRAAVSRILERGPGSGVGIRDPFTEDAGTQIGIPGLTIHDLSDPATAVPPEVAQASQAEPNGDGVPTFPSLDDQPVPEPSFTVADVKVKASSPMRIVWIVLGSLAFVVCVGAGVLANRSRGDG